MLKNLDALDGTFTYPVIIVGAGAAGLTIANELDRAGVRVLLAESGSFEFEENIQDLHAGDVVGLPYPLEASRLHYFGGTTNHWAGQSDTLDETALSYRNWVPYSGWPITHSDLKQYFPKAFEICNLGPYGQDDALRAQFPVLFPEGVDGISPRIFHSSRPIVRFGETYKNAMVNSKNVDLVLHATAVELVSDELGESVTHVHFRNHQGVDTKISGNIVVLACGGIANPRLLLASSSVKRAGLGNEHDLVGRFFMEHPHYVPFSMLLAGSIDISSTTWTTFEKLNATAMTVAEIDPGIQQEEEILQFGYFLYAQSDNFQKKFQGDPIARAVSEGIWAAARSYDQLAGGNVVLEQAPNPLSRVALSEAKDSLGMPRVQLDWRLTELDRDTLVRGCEIMARAMMVAGLGRFRIHPWVYDRDGPPTDEIGFGNHHMGTTRMSDSVLSGVVDRNCRLHSVSNVYIAGSSVFPTSGLANPTMNIVALALRLSEHLIEQVEDKSRLKGYAYEIGATVDFSLDGRGQRFFAEGWSHAESTGTWTQGHRSIMIFDPTESTDGDLILSMKAHPYLAEGDIAEQPITAFVNGTEVDSFLMSEPAFKDYEFRIPAFVLKGNRIVVRFEIPNAASPVVRGRVLGFKLNSASLRLSSASAEQDPTSWFDKLWRFLVR